jgi:hypothetical protein
MKRCRTGAETFGVAVVTAGGLIFVSDHQLKHLKLMIKIQENYYGKQPTYAAVSTPSVYEE